MQSKGIDIEIKEVKCFLWILRVGNLTLTSHFGHARQLDEGYTPNGLYIKTSETKAANTRNRFLGLSSVVQLYHSRMHENCGRFTLLKMWTKKEAQFWRLEYLDKWAKGMGRNTWPQRLSAELKTTGAIA